LLLLSQSGFSKQLDLGHRFSFAVRRSFSLAPLGAVFARLSFFRSLFELRSTPGLSAV
jgi:hypothetical protein